MQPQGCKACLFPVEDMLLEEIQFWIQQWSNNLCSIPHAIHEDSQGRLDLVNLDVWLWNRAIAPIKQEDLFKQVLWRNIFLVIGRWEELVGKTDWQKPVVDQICLSALGVQWCWPNDQAPETVDPAHIVQWLGNVVGVTPDRA